MSRSDSPRLSGAVYRTEYGTDGEPLSTDIAEGVAAVRGEDPTCSSFVLTDHVDPDAVDALAASHGSDWRFDIDVADCHVTVHGDGTLVVRPSARSL